MAKHTIEDLHRYDGIFALLLTEEQEELPGPREKEGQLVEDIALAVHQAYERQQKPGTWHAPILNVPSDGEGDLLQVSSLSRLFVGKPSKVGMHGAFDDNDVLEELQAQKAPNGIYTLAVCLPERNPLDNDRGQKYDDAAQWGGLHMVLGHQDCDDRPKKPKTLSERTEAFAHIVTITSGKRQAHNEDAATIRSGGINWQQLHASMQEHFLYPLGWTKATVATASQKIVGRITSSAAAAKRATVTIEQTRQLIESANLKDIPNSELGAARKRLSEQIFKWTPEGEDMNSPEFRLVRAYSRR